MSKTQRKEVNGLGKEREVKHQNIDKALTPSLHTTKGVPCKGMSAGRGIPARCYFPISFARGNELDAAGAGKKERDPNAAGSERWMTP
jgi:hypothetical protein